MQQPPLQVHLTPRLVSYYEVSILEPPVVVFAITDTRTTATAVPSLLYGNGQVCGIDEAPCVAVGLATDQFPLYSHMPGWDSNSFGYHGDDGKIYHDDARSGIRRYGPIFGAGDVVGCGIDYLARAIFFTLNGQFLGYAFGKLSLKSLQQDFYPTVGLHNTKWPVQCNFGCEQPFVFDLTTIVAARQEETVLQTIMLRNRQSSDRASYTGSVSRIPPWWLPVESRTSSVPTVRLDSFDILVSRLSTGSDYEAAVDDLTDRDLIKLLHAENGF
jgi:hypothetical protein